MDYETKRLKIVLWTVVSLLILSVLGVSLLFILKMHPSTPTPNPVNVGERISRADVSLVPDAVGEAGPDTVSDDGSTSIWHGANTRSWAGSGTQADPYLITKASELYGLSFRVGQGENFTGKYFKLGIDFDMNGDTLSFTPIGSYNNKFQGVFDGNGHTITNLQISTTVAGGLFGYLSGATITNLNIEIIFNQDTNADFGGLAYDVANSSKITDVNISYLETYSINQVKYCYVGGLIYNTRDSTIENCKVNNFTVDAECGSRLLGIYIAGLITYVYNTTVEGCMADVNFDIRMPDTSYLSEAIVAGLVGYENGTNVVYSNNLSCGSIKLTIESTDPHVYVGE